jgi:hypothetical protein
VQNESSSLISFNRVSKTSHAELNSPRCHSIDMPPMPLLYPFIKTKCMSRRAETSVSRLATELYPTPRALERERDLLEHINALRGAGRGRGAARGRGAGKREARSHTLEAGFALRKRALKAVRVGELGMEGSRGTNGKVRGPSSRLLRGLGRRTQGGRGLGRRHPSPAACRRRHLLKDFQGANSICV